MKDKKILNKIKSSIDNQKQYQIFKSKQLLGMILAILFSFLTIVSIVDITGFTTVYDYSFGFLVGYYSYFIFAGFIYYGLSLMFNINIKIEKYLVKKYNKSFNFSWFVYLFFVIGISLITESTITIIKNNTFFPGKEAFKLILSDWWNDFISSKDAALPKTQNSGAIIAFFLSLIVFWSGYPVSIILGIILVLYFAFYIYFGSIIKMFSNSNLKNKKLKGKDLVEHKTKILDLSFEDNNKITLDNNDDINMKYGTVDVSINDIDDSFPIENPFNNDDNKFIETKTKEFNIENNLIDKDFDIEKISKENSEFSNKQTFDFELDIFDTSTEPISNIDNFTDSEKDN